MLNLIFCIDNSGLFGRNNKLIWNFKEDLKYFRDVTVNFDKVENIDNIILMGYNTWISLPFKLPNRTNVVISKCNNLKKTKVLPDYTFNSIESFLEECKKDKKFYKTPIFVIGGKKLLTSIIIKYYKFIKYIFISVVHHSFPQYLDDTIFQISNFENLNLKKTSTRIINCFNHTDNRLYDIQFNKFLNQNYIENEHFSFIESVNNISSIKNNLCKSNYTDVYTNIDENESNKCNNCNQCNDCLIQKCKYLFC